MMFRGSIVLICFLAVGCQEEELRKQARPSEGGSEVPEFEAESIQTVEAGKAATITIANTTVSIPEEGLGEEATIRLRTVNENTLRDSVVLLGEAKGDVVELMMYNKQTEEIFGSNLLDKPYVLSQLLDDVNDDENVKFVIVASPETAEEEVSVVGRKALSTGTLLTGANLTVNLSLTVTHAIIYAVESSESPPSITILSDTKDISNDSADTTEVTSIDCSKLAGGSWINVPGNTLSGLGGEQYTEGSKTDPEGNVLKNADFCVMKYEAKISGEDDGRTATNDQSIPDSRAQGTPWSQVKHAEAHAACRRLGPGYSLVNNAMWQTIARNIETAIASDGTHYNWSNLAALSSNMINQGHTDNVPNVSLPAAADDSPCAGTGNNNCDDSDVQTISQVDFSQKRTHTLSNGSVLWDFSGNVWELIEEEVVKPVDATSDFIFNTPDSLSLRFGPEGRYDTFDTDLQGGLGSFYNLNTTVYINRGGAMNTHGNGGIFSIAWLQSENTIYPNVGFRCAYSE